MRSQIALLILFLVCAWTAFAQTEVEPNNTAAQANLIAYGDSLNAAIRPLGDVDYYRFNAAAKDTVDIFAYCTGNSQLDGRIWLYDAGGNLLTDNDDYGTRLQSRVVFPIPGNGTYYIRYAYYANRTSYPNALEKATDGKSVFPRASLAKVHQTLSSDTGAYKIRLRRLVPLAPVLLSDYVDNINWNSAMLFSTLHPNGLSTEVRFEYGTTTSYGASVPAVEGVISGLYINYVSATVTSLLPNTLYCYRVVATNSAGTSYGVSDMFSTAHAPQGWTSQSSGTTYYLYDVFFTNPSTGIIVSDGGMIFRTTNGGATWIGNFVSPNYASLNGIRFVDANTGFIVGYGGTILKTTDGGNSWTPQTSGTNSQLRAVSFSDANNGTVVGEAGIILRTTNGGTTWTQQSSGTTYWLYGVYFTSAMMGTAVGSSGSLLRTTNGGATWIPQVSGTSQELYGVQFADANNGFAVGYYGTILKTTDGGNTWNPQTSGTTNWLSGISFTNANTGTVVGEVGRILRTTDGGLTWTSQSGGTKNDLWSVHFLDAGTGTAVGGWGTVLRTLGPTLSVTPDRRNVLNTAGNTTFAVTNTGIGSMNWTAAVTSGSSWLSLTSGSSGTNAGTIAASFPANSVGTRVGTITVTAPNATASPVEVIVKQAGSDGRFTEIEPNNTAYQASLMAYDDSLYAAINPAGDVDYYKFNASAGDTVEVYAHNTDGSWLDGSITIYSSSGVYLAYNDDFGNTTRSRVVYALENSGTYYIRYAYYGNWGSFPNAAVMRKGGERNFEETLGSESFYKVLNDSGTYLIRLKKFRPSAPYITGTSVANINWNSAMFYGYLAPNALSTTVTFQYGPSMSYGSAVTATQSPVNALYEVTASAIAPNLLPNTDYNFRMVANNSGGTENSENQIFTTPAAPQGLVSQRSGTDATFRSVYFVDENKGVITSYYGTVLRSTNGGTDWTIRATGNTNSLYSTSFGDAVSGTAVGGGGTILRTTDAGETWSKQTSGVTDYLYGVSFADADNGTAVGASGVILHTTNGGSTWTKQTSNVTNALYGVCLSNSNTGTVVGYGGLILRTTDAGATWVPQTSGTSVYLYGVFFSDVNTGTVVGERGTILRTTNGGLTWTKQTSGTSYWLYGVSLINASWGIAVGERGIVLRTMNGGLNWGYQPSGTKNNLYGVSFVSANVATIVGDYGTILRTTGGPVSVRSEGGNREVREYRLMQNHPNPFNPATTIQYDIPFESNVKLRVFDVLGREVKTLVDEKQPQGQYQIRFEASNLPSGVYFYRLQAGGFVEAKKLLLLK